MPNSLGTSNTDKAPNYIFCQHFNPAEAHSGKCCDCFDIKQVFRIKSTQPKSDNCITDQVFTSK